MPDDVQNKTHLWHVMTPSIQTGDGSEFDRLFVTGGVTSNTHLGVIQALIISDDSWFIEKPWHLGKGYYQTIETRIYNSHWYLHEFMHYVYML